MNKELKKYLGSINEVSHITLDPNGPGVVRIHLIPPKKIKFGISWIAIINGTHILPLATGWAILLREFINHAISYDGAIINDEDVDIVINKTVESMKTMFPKTDSKLFTSDLKDIISTFTSIAKNEEPKVDIGYAKVKDYAKYMLGPQRMDLMVSSMKKNGHWNCNQKCKHCYAYNQEYSEKEELSTSDWKKVIDKCRESFISQLTFTGGEPTLRSDLVELINYSKWFVTRLNTNGVNLSQELCNKLYDASLDSVQVTLYSSEENIHNILVGAPNFDKTISGIKNAINSNLNVSINTPLCTLNKDYVKLLEFGYNLGIRYFTISGLIMTGASVNEKDAYLTKKEILEVYKEAIVFANTHNIEIDFTSPGWISEEDLKALNRRVPMCGACLSNMAIAPDGSIVPCQSFLSDKPLGNMVSDDFKKVWNSKRCVEIRKKASNTSNCLLDKGSIL